MSVTPREESRIRLSKRPRFRQMLAETKLLRLLARRVRRKLRDPLRTSLAVLRAEEGALVDGVMVVDEHGRVISFNDRLLAVWNLPPDSALKHESDFIEPAARLVSDSEEFASELLLIKTDTRASRSGHLLPLRDGRVLALTTLPVIVEETQVAGRVWYFRDVTSEVRSEQLQDALFRIADVSRSAGDQRELFASIHHIVGELMDATNFYIALVVEDDPDGLLDFVYFIDELDPAPPVMKPRGLTGYVLRTGEALLARPADVDALVSSGEVEDIGAPSVDWLGVPLKSGGRSIGVLGVQSYHPSIRFTQRDKEILVFVSQHIAAAIEQKKREAALRESENRYRQMFRNNQAVMMVIDPETAQIVDANPAACRFYGYSSEELRQKRITDINAHPGDEVSAAMQLAISDRHGSFTFRHRLATGEVRDVEIHSGPLEVGPRKLLYSIVHDVTERKRAEKLLRRSEEHFRSLIENASDMIAIVDAQGTLHYTSPSVERVLGYKPQAIVGSNIYDCAHTDDNPSITRALNEAFEGVGSDTPVEIRIRHRDGNWRTLEGATHRLDRESGERLVVNCRDVTDRKQTEANLHSQSAALEASMDGIAIIDERGEFTYVNHAFLDLFGYRNRLDLIGERWAMVQPRRSYPRLVKQILPEFLKNGWWRGESQGKRRDGHAFPIEVSMTRISGGSAVCVIRDITERQVAEEQIKHLAYHDALTELPNRLLFQDRLTVALSHAQREKHKLAVLFLDLDRFKVVNDSLGHDAGDSMLQEVARRLRESIRESDTVSRMGGDEFTILLPNIAHSEDATRIASKILDTIREPIFLRDREVHTTTSIGVSLFPEDGTEADLLLKNADMAMYLAKEQGRNNYQLFNAQVSARHSERMVFENGVRKALAQREFTLYYQPIFDFRSGCINGMEALIRWNHEERGLIAPSHFLPIAESTGLMPAIGLWTLTTACEQTAELQRKGYTGLIVSVNLSVAQIQQADLVDQVRSVLETTGLAPQYLDLEITENGAMQRPESSARALQELRTLGVRISLDDFGMGHSSMSYLKRLPIQTLKIDQSFIRDIHTSADTAAIVNAMIALGHVLRLTVVAEGVELEEQREFLVENGCDMMQGYLFHRPLALDAFEQILAAENARSRQWAGL